MCWLYPRQKKTKPTPKNKEKGKIKHTTHRARGGDCKFTPQTNSKGTPQKKTNQPRSPTENIWSLFTKRRRKGTSGSRGSAAENGSHWGQGQGGRWLQPSVSRPVLGGRRDAAPQTGSVPPPPQNADSGETPAASAAGLWGSGVRRPLRCPWFGWWWW